jgi:hypothetical protein
MSSLLGWTSTPGPLKRCAFRSKGFPIRDEMAPAQRMVKNWPDGKFPHDIFNA